MVNEAQIYIHIPFCIKKCEYCDFLSAPATKQVQADYVRQLINEIRTSMWATEKISVPTIFIGGGTPSILAGEQIEEILGVIKETFQVRPDAEITIEANPGTLTMDKLKCYQKASVNRISIGLQSAHDEELKALGRIHSYEDFCQSYQMAREAGFTNINVDLMSALPYQRLATWKDTLEKICAWQPEHISAYSLIIEEGTPFAKAYAEDERVRKMGEIPKILPSEEEERRMYEETKVFLAKKGYQRYEISNYAKPGFECKHNIGYWTRKNYLGFGLGAASLYRNVRYQNESDLMIYLQGEGNIERESLTTKEQMEEFMFLGLRLDEGVSKEAFGMYFQKEIEDVYGNIITSLLADKLLYQKEERYALTARGIDVSNYVLAQFLFDK